MFGPEVLFKYGPRFVCCRQTERKKGMWVYTSPLFTLTHSTLSGRPVPAGSFLTGLPHTTSNLPLRHRPVGLKIRRLKFRISFESKSLRTSLRETRLGTIGIFEKRHNVPTCLEPLGQRGQVADGGPLRESGNFPVFFLSEWQRPHPESTLGTAWSHWGSRLMG